MVPSMRQSDLGGSILPHAHDFSVDNSEFKAAHNMASSNGAINVTIFNVGASPAEVDGTRDGVVLTEGDSFPSKTRLPAADAGLSKPTASRGPKMPGWLSRFLPNGLTHARKGTLSGASTPSYDSDTPPLTPGSSCASSPSSSQEDIRLSLMTEPNPLHLASQNLTNSEVYHRSMLKSGKGLPISRPRPSNPGFGERGTIPGDVGTFSVNGGFKKTFNIWDNEAGLQRVASHLHIAPLRLPSRHVKVYPDDIPQNRTITEGASSTVNLCGYNPSKPASFDFRCQSQTGAVLVATSSADLEELDDLIELRDWIIEYAELIYIMAYSLRRFSDEEPLYIVSGCIKSESCALAAFKERGVPPFDLMRLQNTTRDGDARPSFLWTAQCSSSDAMFGASDQAGLKNQTLFVNGYTLDFSLEFRSRVKRTPILTTNGSPASDFPNPCGLSTTQGSGGGFRGSDESRQGTRRGGHYSSGASNSGQLGGESGANSAGGGQAYNTAQHSAGQSRPSLYSRHREVSVHSFPSSPLDFCHPSGLITKQLLDATGEDFALCHDNQWRPASERLDAPDFVDAIISDSKIVTCNGVASLEPAADVSSPVETQGLETPVLSSGEYPDRQHPESQTLALSTVHSPNSPQLESTSSVLSTGVATVIQAHREGPLNLRSPSTRLSLRRMPLAEDFLALQGSPPLLHYTPKYRGTTGRPFTKLRGGNGLVAVRRMVPAPDTAVPRASDPDPLHLEPQDQTKPEAFFRSLLLLELAGLPLLGPQPEHALGAVGTLSTSGGFEKVFNLWDDETSLQLLPVKSVERITTGSTGTARGTATPGGGSHPSFTKPDKCHMSTRREVISEILGMIYEDCRTESIFWISGPAGSGKRALCAGEVRPASRGAMSQTETCDWYAWAGGSIPEIRLRLGDGEKVQDLQALSLQGFRMGHLQDYGIWVDLVEFVERCPRAQRVLLLRDAARAVEYLHRKYANTFMSDDLSSLPTNFIYSRVLSFGRPTTELKTLFIYLAPELMDFASHPQVRRRRKGQSGALTTKQRDVWAFGLVGAEVVGGSEVFGHIREIPLPESGIVDQGRRPKRPDFKRISTEGDTVWPLLEMCWGADPGERPSIDGVLVFLSDSQPPAC